MFNLLNEHKYTIVEVHKRKILSVCIIHYLNFNVQDNLNFLTGITGRSTAASGKCTWAWLRLGVHYLAADEPSLAVQALQSALRGYMYLYVYLD